MTRRDFFKWLAAALGIIASVVMDINGLELINKDRSLHKASAAAVSPNKDKPPLKDEPVMTQSGGKLLLSLFLLSDLHVTVFESMTTKKLKQALNDITAFESPVDAIVFGGDLTDYGQAADYQKLSNTLNKYKLPPYYANMGNHEYYDVWLDAKGKIKKNTMPNGKTDQMSRDRFQKFMGYRDKPYHDFWLSGVHLIMLSQETYRQEMKDVGEGAWYSDAQMNWLKKKLHDHQEGKPVLIFIHQPLPAKGQEGSVYQLIRATEFRDILAPYKNVFVFSGHTHRNFNEKGHYVKESFDWIINASVGRTRPVGSGLGAYKPIADTQGCYIQVYEHKVVVRGREFSNRSWIAKANWSFPI